MFIYFLLDSIILPFIMVAMGVVIMKNGSREIGEGFGFKSELARKNRDTWNFAHNFGGRACIYIGVFEFATSCIVLSILMTSEMLDHIFVNFVASQILGFITAIPLTQMALRKKFDRFGRVK